MIAGMPATQAKPTSASDAPLSALWRPTALSAVMLAGEALALLLALGPAQPAGERLVIFGLASLGIQWVALATLCSLYLLRQALAHLQPPTVAWVCLGLLLAMSLLVSLAAWNLLDQASGIEQGRTWFVLRMLSIRS